MDARLRAGAVRLGHAGMAAIPFVIWALMLKRPELGALSCPPSGEGRLLCELQQSWVAWLTVVAVAGAATHGLVWILAVTVPGVTRRLRNGERLRYGTPPSRRAWQGDGALAAAVWAPASQPGPHARTIAERALDRARHESVPAADGLAVCGRCHRSQAIRGWRAVCPHCGGVALRALMAPRPAGATRTGVAVR